MKKHIATANRVVAGVTGMAASSAVRWYRSVLEWTPWNMAANAVQHAPALVLAVADDHYHWRW